MCVHKASCHSMLSALLAAGWLLRDPVRKTYHLGPALVRLGREAADQYPALVLARSVMVELSAATGAHCVAFSVSDDYSTAVDQVRSPHGGGHPMPIGTQFPHRPPHGASTVAWARPEARERWLTSIHQEEWFPISLAPDRTYEVSHIDSPILDPESRIALMLSLVPSPEPMSGTDVTRLGEQLSSVTRRLSAALTDKL